MWKMSFSAKSGLTNVVRTGLNLLRAKYLRNRRIGVFDRKTVFLPNLTNFPDLGVNRKVVDNGLFYLNMHFQRNCLSRLDVNDPKPSKMAIFSTKLLIKNLSFFGKNAVYVSCRYSPEPSYKISRKSLEPFLRKTGNYQLFPTTNSRDVIGPGEGFAGQTMV